MLISVITGVVLLVASRGVEAGSLLNELLERSTSNEERIANRNVEIDYSLDDLGKSTIT